MENTTRAFDQLSEADQKAAIDIMVALAVLSTRIPSVQKPLTDYIMTEFASCHNLSKNIVKYALMDVGAALFIQDWNFTATKASNQFITQFQPQKPSDNGQES